MRLLLWFFSCLFRFSAMLKRRAVLSRAIGEGLLVGEKVRFVGSQDFGSEPFLIEIGAGTLITDGVRFVNHDGGIQVPLVLAGQPVEQVYGNFSVFGEIKVGKNCFIGINAIILPDTNIGDNCLVGAGSLVKGSFPDNVVIAGNPARVICSLEQYHEKNAKKIQDMTSQADRRGSIQAGMRMQKCSVRGDSPRDAK